MCHAQLMSAKGNECLKTTKKYWSEEASGPVWPLPRQCSLEQDFCIFALLHGLIHLRSLQFAEFSNVKMRHHSLMVERPQIPSVQAS